MSSKSSQFIVHFVILGAVLCVSHALRCFHCTDCAKPFEPAEHRLSECRVEEDNESGSGDEAEIDVTLLRVEKRSIFLREVQQVDDDFELITKEEATKVIKEPETSAAEDEDSFVCFIAKMRVGDTVRVDRGCAVFKEPMNETCEVLVGDANEGHTCSFCQEEGCNFANFLMMMNRTTIIFISFITLLVAQ